VFFSVGCGLDCFALNILFDSPSALFFLEIFSAASTPCTPPPANFSVDIRACHRIIGFCSGNGKYSLAF